MLCEQLFALTNIRFPGLIPSSPILVTNMKLSKIIFIVAILTRTADANITEEIKKLRNIELQTAKEVVKSLEVIASNKNNIESGIAKLIGSSIKKVFTCEFLSLQAMDKIKENESIVSQLQDQGAAYMKPNAFGTVNKTAAEEKYKNANDLRAKSIRLLNESSANLENSLRELRAVAANSALSESDKKILNDVSSTIENRTLDPAKKLAEDTKINQSQTPDALSIEQANREQVIATEEAIKRREAALRQMKRAIRTGDKLEEAKALKMLIDDAPDAVAEFNNYLATKAAREREAIDNATRRKIDEIERRTRSQ